MSTKLYFIAELSQNHQGSLKIAKQMVDALGGTGIKAIKTSKRDIDTCLTAIQKAAPYINKNSFGATYYEHRKALELSNNDFIDLKEYIEAAGFDFIPSFTDRISLNFLVGIGLKKLKIASQRVTDIKLLKYTAKKFTGTIFMSSGMSDFNDVEQMVKIFEKHKKYLLQCTSIYPTNDHDLNLRVLKYYRKHFKHSVNGFGFSGHNKSVAPDIAAYALGAHIIERHFTLDRTWKGTDHAGALELYHIKKLIKYLNEVAVSLGDSAKELLSGELPAAEKLRGDLK